MAKDSEDGGGDTKPKFKTTVKMTATELEQQCEDEILEGLSKPIQGTDGLMVTPLKALDDAVENQRTEERKTMQKLIDDNVKMGREVKKADERVQEMHTKIELMKLDVEAEKVKTKEKENQITEMENEMTMLIMSKKTKKEKKKKKKKGEFDEDDDMKDIKDKYGPADPFDAKHDKQVRDLKFRLKRLAADDEAKDKRVTELNQELEMAQNYIQELERHVGDSDKLDRIKEDLKEKEKNNAQYYDPANVVASGRVRQSSVCTIQ